MIEACVAEVCGWMGQNKLENNGDRTEFMAIASAFMQKVIAELKLRLHVGDAVVAPADS